MLKETNSGIKLMLLASALASSLVVSTVLAQSPQGANPTAPAKPATGGSSRFSSSRLPRSAEMYYQAVWGVDSFKIKYTESGEMIRFTWRVVDPVKAAQLNDKKAEPFLYDPQARVKLVVPQMEKVGQLRQSSTPIAGKSYWMAFSNSGRRVRPGDRVSIEIGQFRAINLVVE
jgi:hypothetical protein